MKIVERSQYLEFLIESREKQVIKVVSGVRRCGKSTLFDMYRSWLLSNGVLSDQILYINFEDADYEYLCNYTLLHEYIKKHLDPDRMNYIFLDEIQHVKHFEKAVDSLYIKKNVDLYITGSNAYFMSGELATLLSGRYLELKMLPFSFKEFCTAYDGLYADNRLAKLEKYHKYTELGSFPYILNFGENSATAQAYLRGIYDSVLIKDVVGRYKIADVTMLESLVKFMLHSVGSLVSSTNIANTMTSKGRKIDQKTVEKYLRSLTESLIFYEAKRYNIKGKQYLATLEKYYVVDIGLRRLLLGTAHQDVGHVLENIVYLELVRRGYDVAVGQLGDIEVDFVVMQKNSTEYYQVAASVLDKNTFEREIRSLQKIADHHPKFLLTLDEPGKNSNFDGIRQLNVLDWLLGAVQL